MKLEKLLNQHVNQQELDYSKFTDAELDRIIEIFGDREEYDLLSVDEQNEIDSLTKKAMQR